MYANEYRHRLHKHDDFQRFELSDHLNRQSRSNERKRSDQHDRSSEVTGKHRDWHYHSYGSNSPDRSSNDDERYLTSNDKSSISYDIERGNNDCHVLWNGSSSFGKYDMSDEDSQGIDAAYQDSMLHLQNSTFTQAVQLAQNNRCDYPNGHSSESLSTPCHQNDYTNNDDTPKRYSPILSSLTDCAYEDPFTNSLFPYHQNDYACNDDDPQNYPQILRNLTDYAYEVPSPDHTKNPSEIHSEFLLASAYGAGDLNFDCDILSFLPDLLNETHTSSKNTSVTNGTDGMDRSDTTSEATENEITQLAEIVTVLSTGSSEANVDGINELTEMCAQETRTTDSIDQNRLASEDRNWSEVLEVDARAFLNDNLVIADQDSAEIGAHSMKQPKSEWFEKMQDLSKFLDEVTNEAGTGEVPRRRDDFVRKSIGIEMDSPPTSAIDIPEWYSLFHTNNQTTISLPNKTTISLPNRSVNDFFDDDTAFDTHGIERCDTTSEATESGTTKSFEILTSTANSEANVDGKNELTEMCAQEARTTDSIDQNRLASEEKNEAEVLEVDVRAFLNEDFVIADQGKGGDSMEQPKTDCNGKMQDLPKLLDEVTNDAGTGEVPRSDDFVQKSIGIEMDSLQTCEIYILEWHSLIHPNNDATTSTQDTSVTDFIDDSALNTNGINLNAATSEATENETTKLAEILTVLSTGYSEANVDGINELTEMCAQTRPPESIEKNHLASAYEKIVSEVLELDAPTSLSDVIANEDSTEIGANNIEHPKIDRSLELQDPSTFLNQATNKVGTRKRRRHKDYGQKSTGKEMVSTATSTIKNNNPAWHSLSKEKTCKICRVSYGCSLVNHYVNVHPNHEVYPSRVAPNVAEILRASNALHECEIVKLTISHRLAYRQFCYFCDTVLSTQKYLWIKHMAVHTGYFQYECTGCSQKFSRSRGHNCGDGRNINKVPQCQFDAKFEEVNVIAYLCDLCNYVRFDETEMENHLKNEHGDDVEGNFKEVIFLSFPESKNDLKVTEKSTEPRTTSLVVKNNNPDWYGLNQQSICRICDCGVRKRSLVLHYVNFHPDSEVFPSRVKPNVANFLRNSTEVHRCEIVKSLHKRLKYKQMCYFCNVEKCSRKVFWIDHLITHTGYVRFDGTGCLRKVADNLHVCGDKCNVKRVLQPQFEGTDVIAYLCDLCNFVRFTKSEIEKHLICEHEGDIKDQFKEVTFLSFPESETVVNSRNGGGSIQSLINYKELPVQKRKFELGTTSSAIKNNNPDWHCLNKKDKCVICACTVAVPLVKHYVDAHPNSEVIPSRVAPDVARFLRSRTFVSRCEIITTDGAAFYKQFCYFCNKPRCCTKQHWFDHIMSHTGYYRFQCTDCSKKFAHNSSHECVNKCYFMRLPQPQFKGVNVIAYLCDLCNFVRFEKTEIEKHLRHEHEVNVMDYFKEIIFLSFPDWRKKLEPPRK